MLERGKEGRDFKVFRQSVTEQEERQWLNEC